VARLGFFRRGEQSGAPALEARVAAAQAGDEASREALLTDYRPFVLRVASRACGRFLRPEVDDEASVALIAFNEAIDRYDAQSGASFVTFAEMVVKRRLIDHFRRARGSRETPLSDFEVEDAEGQVSNPVEVAAALSAHRERDEAEERRLDIERFKSALGEFGIGLGELVRASPQHRDARERAIAVARAVADNPEWSSYLREHRALPLKAIERAGGLGLSRKTLERQRKYIIAVALVLMERIEHLMAYLPET
jgi:RNA polymerase sigma factor